MGRFSRQQPELWRNNSEVILEISPAPHNKDAPKFKVIDDAALCRTVLRWDCA